MFAVTLPHIFFLLEMTLGERESPLFRKDSSAPLAYSPLESIFFFMCHHVYFPSNSDCISNMISERLKASRTNIRCS